MQQDPSHDPLAVLQPLAGAALLRVWEHGLGQTPPLRALTLLCAGCPALPPEEAAALPVTLRDQALVRLHALNFGPTLSATAACGSCAERLEFVLSAQEVAETLRAAPTHQMLTQDGVSMRLRLANTQDVMDAAAAEDLPTGRHLLLARCASPVDDDGRTGPAPEFMSEAALERLDAMHEAAEITPTLACPACEAQQAVHFDVAEFLWVKIRHAAQRLLDEVHELAWAYGWTEAEILGMSSARRNAYLDRARS